MKKKAKAKAKKRLVRGKDWHAWVYKSDTDGLYKWAVAAIPPESDTEDEPGKWVRVKFVEVGDD